MPKSFKNRKNRFWEKFEKDILKIVIKAFEILKTKNIQSSDNENIINKSFYQSLVQANSFLRDNKQGGFPTRVKFEEKNLPQEDDKVIHSYQNKIPDFKWERIDSNETDGNKRYKDFIMECKILGTPKRSDWVFNKNYVLNGIVRFIDTDYRYSGNMPKGIITGYVLSMDMNDILTEVNTYISSSNLPSLNTPVSWNNNEITILEHQELLNRNFDISPFELKHLWLDLR